jgi:hypothetical protein
VIDPASKLPVFLFLINSLSPPDPDLIGVCDSTLRGVMKYLELSFQFGWLPPVVTIQKRQPGIAGKRDPVIPSCAHTGAFLPYIPDPPVIPSLHHTVSGVSGAVVNNDEFPIYAGLVDHRLDCPGN